MDLTKCSIVGVGKLGACVAACLAHKGFDVVGLDVNDKVISAINAGLPPVFEPGLADIMAANKVRLRATANYADAIKETDVTFVVVPTPSDEQGGFSLRYVTSAISSIGQELRRKESYHLVVLTSTVLPGSTDYGIKPVLEKESGKVCGRDFGLCYNPEFIALGYVIHDFLNPDFVLIGESDEQAGNMLAGIYKKVCDNNPPVVRMNFVNAELAKIAVNTFVTTKITFANMLAELCEQLPGGDVDAVTSALGLDSRIGQRYLKGGLGYGGPCFPRDNVAMAYLARRLASQALLPESTDKQNRQLLERIIVKATRWITPDSTVAVLGLSYKPRSNVVEESQGLYIAERLAQDGAKVIVYDPVAMENAKKVLNNKVNYAKTLPDALKKANFVVIANPEQAFVSLKPNDFPVRPLIVIDCWRVLRKTFNNVPGVEYIPLGVGNYDAALIKRVEALWRV